MAILPRLTRSLGCLTLASLIAYASTSVAEPPSEFPAAERETSAAQKYKKPGRTKFLRLKRNGEGDAIALQTSIVRYRPASGEGDLVVDLIGAVHVADRSYYKTLNKQFDEYDVVLYELVAPEGMERPDGPRDPSDNPLAMIQKLARTVLRLESQLDLIDYKKKNLVHADLSPEKMMEEMKRRGEDGVTLFLGVASDLLREYNRQQLKLQEQIERGQKPELSLDIEGVDPLSLLVDPNAPIKLKRVMAEQFEQMDLESGAGLGQTINNILIQDRNKAAMRVFQKELAKGKRRIGIFYGAAHMPDFERRLVTEFGLKKSGEHWLTAWDMQIRGEDLQELFKVLDELSR